MTEVGRYNPDQRHNNGSAKKWRERLFQRISRPTAHADLRQVVIASQLSQIRFDRVTIRTSRFLDFFDRDFSSRLGEFQYLA
jgi:hypothetical protein